MAKKEKKVLLVIDANSLIHRAYHALPPLTTAKGEMVNAVYGFLLVFFKAIKEIQPDYIAAAFDLAGPTFRHKKFKEYKAARVKAPDELYQQIPIVKKVLGAFGVPVYEKEGFEADDLIGTLAKLVPQKQVYPPVETVIVSGDLDMLQLVDEFTKVYTTRKSIQDSVLYDRAAVEKKFEGLQPSQMRDYKALRGDPSDNISGVPGIGEKTAMKLLNEFGSLETLYQRLEEREEIKNIKPRIARLLLDCKEQAFGNRELVTIDRNVPLDIKLEDLRLDGFSAQRARDILQELEFQTLLSRLQELAGKKEKKKVPQEDFEQNMQDKIERLFKEHVFSKELYEVEKKLAPILKSMEEAGIKIDKPYFQKLSQEMEGELAALRAKIHGQAGKEFNINSTQQLGEVLFRDLELPVKGLKKTPKGVISTASPELEKLRGVHPIVEEIFKYREIQKLLTTYAKPLQQLADDRGRVHTHFDQLGAATGRISSLHPNLQNIPNQGEWGKRIRRGFVAEKGFSLVSFDYSQMELRIAAHIAKDKKMQAIFQQGADIHRLTAAEVFGVPAREVTDEMRYRAKALNFGVLYGMGAPGFAKSAKIPLEEARAFIEHYFTRFPQISEYMEQTKEFAREHGYVETLLGRKRYLPDINSTTPQLRAATERMAMNHPIQGSLADIMKMAMVKIHQKLHSQHPKWKMLLQIHDELLFEIADDMIPIMAPQIRKIMETVYTLQVPIAVQIKAGKNWNDGEKISL